MTGLTEKKKMIELGPIAIGDRTLSAVHPKMLRTVADTREISERPSVKINSLEFLG